MLVDGSSKLYEGQENSEGRRGKCDWTDFGREGPKSRGEEPRPSVKVPKCVLSAEGGVHAMTLRRWAWKQPSYDDRVPAH